MKDADQTLKPVPTRQNEQRMTSISLGSPLTCVHVDRYGAFALLLALDRLRGRLAFLRAAAVLAGLDRLPSVLMARRISSCSFTVLNILPKDRRDLLFRRHIFFVNTGTLEITPLVNRPSLQRFQQINVRQRLRGGDITRARHKHRMLKLMARQPIPLSRSRLRIASATMLLASARQLLLLVVSAWQ